jgi:hypothetical protein
VVGATIAGGGAGDYFGQASANVVAADFGSVGGGSQNHIAKESRYATIGGGRANQITNSAHYAVVPGGSRNCAGGDFSFAAGRRAKALHEGAFVWADSMDADFASTGNSQFLIRASGGLGLGVTNPSAQLHVASAGNKPQLQLEQQTVGQAARLRIQSWGLSVVHDTKPSLDFWNGSSTVMSISHSGALTATSFNQTSDRNAKTNFESINPRTMLDKVAALPIQTWTFKSDKAVRHMGPVAQDFHAAFGVGPDDKHIACGDVAGVALVAIQGLNQKLEEELAQKNTEIQALNRRLEKLERLLGCQSQGPCSVAKCGVAFTSCSTRSHSPGTGSETTRVLIPWK